MNVQARGFIETMLKEISTHIYASNPPEFAAWRMVEISQKVSQAMDDYEKENPTEYDLEINAPEIL